MLDTLYTNNHLHMIMLSHIGTCLYTFIYVYINVKLPVVCNAYEFIWIHMYDICVYISFYIVCISSRQICHHTDILRHTHIHIWINTYIEYFHLYMYTYLGIILEKIVNCKNIHCERALNEIYWHLYIRIYLHIYIYKTIYICLHRYIFMHV
jgi:hypothetical protein